MKNFKLLEGTAFVLIYLIIRQFLNYELAIS